MMDLANNAVNMLFGGNVNQLPFQGDHSPLNAAVVEMRRRGYSVHATNIPGLFDVHGVGELTVNQMLSVAFRSNVK